MIRCWFWKLDWLEDEPSSLFKNSKLATFLYVLIDFKALDINIISIYACLIDNKTVEAHYQDVFQIYVHRFLI